MKKILLLLNFVIGCFVFAQLSPPPYQTGDFRSKGSGAWNNVNSWEVYNGTGFMNASSFPGQGTTSTSQGNYKAVVQPGHTITVSADVTYYFGDLYILASPLPTVFGSGSYGQVSISGNGTQLQLLGTDQDVIVYGGKLFFASNNTELFINLGSSVVLAYYNGPVKEGGDNLLRPESAGDGCTGNQQIKFVDPAGIVQTFYYAVCNGANSQYNFRDLNWGGGTISPIPTATANPVCVGQSVLLSGSYTGYIPPAPEGSAVSYVWSLVSGPPGYSFTTTAANTSPNQTVNFATAGTYVFNLQAYYFSQTFTQNISGNQTITITVNPSASPLCACYKEPVIVVDPLNPIAFPSNYGITSFGRVNEKWPKSRENAYMVLEAKTKGFVINRLSTAQLNTIVTNGQAVDGMMAYDSDAGCLKIYVDDTANPTKSGWHCFKSPACPD